MLLRTKSQLYDPETEKSQVIPWNFAKFFIDSKGEIIQYFAPEEPIETVVDYIDEQMSAQTKDEDL